MKTPDAFDLEEPRTQAPAWLVDLTIVLGLAVIVLGARLFQELRSEPEAPEAAPTVPAISSREATEILDAELGALKAFLPDVYGPMHTPDSVFIDRTSGVRLSGADQLEHAIANEDVGFAVDPVRTSKVVVAHGDVAVYGTTWGGTPTERRNPGIVIVTLEDGKISREVIIPMGGVRANDDLLP